MLDWSDPPRAAKMIEGPALGKMRDADVQFLEVRGMVYADVRRDVDVEGTLARLKSLAEDGDQSATRRRALCEGVFALSARAIRGRQRGAEPTST